MIPAERGTDPADLIRVRVSGDHFDTLRRHLIRSGDQDPVEHAAFLVAGTQEYEMDGRDVLEFLVREVHPLPREEYIEQGSAIVRFDHSTIRRMMVAAETEHRHLNDMAVLMCHSHPYSASPHYSSTDNSNEPPHMAALTGHTPGPHGSLLFGQEGIDGRAWRSDVAAIRRESVSHASAPIDEILVLRSHELERRRTTSSRLPPGSGGTDEMRERQALLHDPQGNTRLREAHVAVVGAGGLGSLIVQSLAHIGVGRLTVVDPDVVETSNRSRIVGAQPDDAGPAAATPDQEGVIPAQWAKRIDESGRPKIQVLEDLVNRVDPSIDYCGIPEVAQHAEALEHITMADVIVSATDTATSRRFLSQAAQVYLRPLFDAGVDIDVSEEGSLLSIASGFHVSGAGRACLDCMGVIDPDRITAENKSQANLEYGLDLVEGEQPSVLTVNMEPAQRTCFAIHRYLTGLMSDRAPFREGTFTFTGNRIIDRTERNPGCVFCDGTLTAAGDRTLTIGKEELERKPPPSPSTDKGDVEGSAEERGWFWRIRKGLSNLWMHLGG